MRNSAWMLLAIVGCAAPCLADIPQTPAAFTDPIYLTLQEEPESVYAPPAPPSVNQGVNQGGANFDLTIRYMTDYVFRGLDRSDGDGLELPVKGPNGQIIVNPAETSKDFGHEDAPNLQVESKLSFDLGKLPHPYLGVFVNVYDSDPVSRFQEVRPYFGAVWTIRPFIFEGGHQTFIFPEREKLNTSEIYGKITFDDSTIFKTDQPILSPYIYGAYDYDLYNGWYFESGVKHDFVFQDWGVTFTALADVAFVMKEEEYLLHGSNDTGFQHYDLGLTASYSLNQLLNFSKRYGEFNIEGYLYYTNNIDSHLLATDQIWGGMGIAFKY